MNLNGMGSVEWTDVRRRVVEIDGGYYLVDAAYLVRVPWRGPVTTEFLEVRRIQDGEGNDVEDDDIWESAVNKMR